MHWTDTEAQEKFDELLDKVESEGPQTIRREDAEYVVMTLDEWDEHAAGNQAAINRS